MLDCTFETEAAADLAVRLNRLEEQLGELRAARPDDAITRALFDELADVPGRVVSACAAGSIDSADAALLAESARSLLGELGSIARSVRAGSFERINDAFMSLSSDMTPDDLVAAAPEMLCRIWDFDRAMISRVRGSSWIPAILHIGAGLDDPVNIRLAETITTLEVPLTGSLIETDILRRRAATLVDGAAVERHPSHILAGVTQSRAYVAAPIVIADRVAGFVHADTYSSRRVLTSADRVALQAFADMFGLAYERAAMAEKLRKQHGAIEQALTSAANSVAEIGSDVGQLVRTETRERPVASVDPVRGHDPFEASNLNRREWEILGLLATGATNRQIAATLVVSENTVKSHVKRILHKLPAANRAEAVYRYTQLTRSRVS
jgi:DNA-binding CsgD family transcriptional regulator/GAF domain-containing protein